MKYILVILDGMGDKPVKKLKGRTPLEAAKTPHMDFFARRGEVGLSRTIPNGFVPGTDIGCMSVFGYDPAKYFTGRGPLEAAELGIELKKNEIAFRCNLITAEGEILKDFCADHIPTADARQLLESFNKKIKDKYGDVVRFYPGRGTGYRNLAVFNDTKGGLSRTPCTPPHDIMGKKYSDFLPRGPESEMLKSLMTDSKEFFKNHLINKKRVRNGQGEASMIWLWGQGYPPSLPSYYKRFGLRGGVITAVDLVKGIAIHAGLDVIRVPGVTGFFDTNYVGKAEYAINSLRSRDFVAIHIESPDEAGHMGDAALKIKAIEDVDRLVLGTLRRHLKEFDSYKILLLADHYTCVETRTHSSDAVPFFIYSNKKEKKGPKNFSEKSAKISRRPVAKGHELMNHFIRE